MRAIMVMFDSLNRRMLPNYGGDWVHAPNFVRLASRTVTFENCYGGSMPCMPARREMHTGRYNFLHRSWGPLEPFDDSVPAMLTAAGVHTHLATDHQHYWEDGGATYHNRFSTYEFFRGQEGDPWKGQVADPEIPDALGMSAKVKPKLWRQDWVNRAHLEDRADHPQTLTFDAGVEFIETNKDDDSWFVQIETFDPHEPFFSYAEYKTHYGAAQYDGPHFDWPDYAKVTETPEAVEHARAEYAALLTMCDESLGRILDLMDEHDMWGDTMLIVCTDHGFMLGEHGWWGKNVQPWYDETIHNPLFVWDPRAQVSGERRGALVQTIDFGPTLLDFFGLSATEDMQGSSLATVMADDTPVREYGLFGVFGGHVCITDGRYVYMRASATPQNQPLSEHTLMPTVMNGFFPHQMLAHAQLVEPLPFTKGLKVLKTPAHAWVSPYAFGTQLFDLATDPEQQNPLQDAELELRLATALRDTLVSSDAPAEQFDRLGLPASGPLSDEHLLIAGQWPMLQASLEQAARIEDFGADGVVLEQPLGELLAHEGTRAVLIERAPMLAHGPMVGMIEGMTLLQIASMMVGLLPRPVLAGLAQLLTEAAEPSPAR
ncbi:sulfatase [Microbacterium sp. AK031]|uniref:sulfatase n=1 Tax=Microbacterium sp. AK031 TaxID=2723076 RepID=UPI0021684D49|nr:sulfatase [Microbacterium sp. AK031]MCS3842372.1 arylsulfatase A-like enzyme [Microbacterium sp. AK031]